IFCFCSCCFTDKLGIVPDKVCENIQECEVDVVLSPDTAHSDISVDNDAAQVRFTGDTKGPNTWCCVTGSDWLKARQDHYWEVEVAGKGSWAIGLASESIKDEQLIAECPTNELWIIRLCRGKKLAAISRTYVKEYQLKPNKVGFHWEGNCLRVYDKEKKQLIHKFDIEYSEHLYPVFSPGSHDRGPLIIKIKNTETENLKQKFGIALKLNTKYPNIINVDNQQIRLTGKEQVPGDLWPCVLANNKLTSEKAYWEVEVGEKSSWALGVVADTKEVKMSISDEPEEGFWIIKVQAEKIHAVYSSGSVRILRKPRKVGVFVDFVEQELSFYDIEKKYLIHRFHIKSSEKLYPIFSPGVQDKGPLIII
uniref:B30.2/SPRY domain-containing protein n=1 Tax=Erpetoichthys calabaricus TaxID=27687 RepID=A0A8C4XIE4_ERPCA